MRARQLKPGFFKNEDLAECSPWARLVFAGLWTMADRSGRLEDRPKRIKAELLPFDDEPIGPLLEELERWGFIRRYTVDGLKLLWIPKFGAHQNPHKAEKPSDFPAHPDDHSGSASDKAQEEHGASTVQAQCKDGSRRASSPIPSSPIPDCLKRNTPHTQDVSPPARTREEQPPCQEPGVCASDFDPAPELDAMPIEFQDLVGAYPPGKVDLVPSFRAYDRLRRSPHFQIQAALQDVAERSRSPSWTESGGRFVPKLSKYLTEQRWRDPPDGKAADDQIVKRAQELSKRVEERERRDGLRP